MIYRVHGTFDAECTQSTILRAKVNKLVCKQLGFQLKCALLCGLRDIKVAYEGQRKLNGKGVYLRFACGLMKEFERVLLYTSAFNAQ